MFAWHYPMVRRAGLKSRGRRPKPLSQSTLLTHKTRRSVNGAERSWWMGCGAGSRLVLETWHSALGQCLRDFTAVACGPQRSGW